MYIRQSAGNIGGDPNVVGGNYTIGALRLNTGYIDNTGGRRGNVTHGKQKGITYIIKVL